MRNHRIVHFVGAALLVSTMAVGCRTQTAPQPVAPATAASSSVVSDRLFFGRNIPAGGTVSDVDWAEFLRTVVTPRFPDGLTVWTGNGQWLDPRGTIVKEQVFAIEILHPRSDAVEASIAAIAAAYKQRFGQDAVLRVTTPTSMRFY